MTLDRAVLERTVDRHTIKSATKLVFVTVGLLALLTLASFLPGVDRVLLDTGVTFIALADAVVTLAIVAVLLALAPRLATVVRTWLDGPRDAVEHVASAVYWLVALLAVLVAHWGLSSVGTALLGGAEWLYDLAFLLAALVPLTATTVRLSAVLDPAADAVADLMTTNDETANDETQPGDGAAETGVSADDRTAETGDDDRTEAPDWTPDSGES